MNPYHVVGMITFCTVVFAGVVSLLVFQGVPVLAAFLSVYGVVFLWMRSMQRRASQSFEDSDWRERDGIAYLSLGGDSASSVR